MEGGSGKVEQVSSSALGICEGTLFSERTPVEVVVAPRSFLIHSYISCSILNKSLSCTTRAKHSWISCTSPQNMSGGALARWHTAGVWWPAWQSSPFAPPSNHGLSRGPWAQGTPSFSAPTGRVGWSRHHVLSFEWLVSGKQQPAGGP